MTGLFRTFLMCAVASLGACNGSGRGVGPLGVNALFGSNTLAGARPLFGKNQDRCFESAGVALDILTAREARYWPESGRQRTLDSPDRTSDDKKQILAAYDNCRELHKAIYFARPKSIEDSVVQKLHRNEILDALIATSDKKCSDYTNYLKNYDVSMNGQLGIAAIVTAGLGSILGGETTAKALAGSSAIIGGTRAELNKVALSNIATHVLVKAYTDYRSKLRDEMTSWQQCSVDTFTHVRAVQMALDYHSACSIVVGLYRTDRAVDELKAPSLETLKNAFAEALAVRALADSYKPPESDPANGSQTDSPNAANSSGTKAPAQQADQMTEAQVKDIVREMLNKNASAAGVTQDVAKAFGGLTPRAYACPVSAAPPSGRHSANGNSANQGTD
jgi:hypothetical protein